MIGDRRERYHAAENIWKKEYDSAGRLRLWNFAKPLARSEVFFANMMQLIGTELSDRHDPCT
jgi:hypothetical protein